MAAQNNPLNFTLPERYSNYLNNTFYDLVAANKELSKQDRQIAFEHIMGHVMLTGFLSSAEDLESGEHIRRGFDVLRQYIDESMQKAWDVMKDKIMKEHTNAE